MCSLKKEWSGNNCFVDFIPRPSSIHVARFVLIDRSSWEYCIIVWVPTHSLTTDVNGFSLTSVPSIAKQRKQSCTPNTFSISTSQKTGSSGRYDEKQKAGWPAIPAGKLKLLYEVATRNSEIRVISMNGSCDYWENIAYYENLMLPYFKNAEILFFKRYSYSVTPVRQVANN
ncbi:hypothetical protein TNCV_2708231 [Trichonephila clavipes]|nr:hypothetical protein TNCV_2708231 [Trichonephila clavipes]